MIIRLIRQRMRCNIAVIGMLLPLGLSACALAPGGHIDYNTDSSLIDTSVEVEPITAELIRKMDETVYPDMDSLEQARKVIPDVSVDYDFEIGRGDVLSIIVYDHPQLTIPAGSERSAEESGNIVHSDGTIYYPYVGQVNVQGRTVREVRDEIQRRLTDYIADPQVDVKVAAFRSQKAYVTGQVDQPGALPITDTPMRVLDALSHAGGLTEMANWRDVVLTRDGQDMHISVFDMLTNGKLAQNLQLQDGDVLHVPEVGNERIFVMGEVNQPSSFGMANSHLSLTAAIAQAGGIREGRANASGIFVIRNNPSNSEKFATVYQLNAKNAAAFVLGTQFMLQPTDVVYVTAAPLARWNRVLSLLLPSLSTLYMATELQENISE